MEKWLSDAKQVAKDEAEEFVHTMKMLASHYNLESEWFIDEVLKNINQLNKGE